MKHLALYLVAALLPAEGQAAPLAGRTQAELDRLLAGRVAQPPTHCIPRLSSQHVTAYGDRTLVFSETNRTLYRNDPPGGCNGAGRDGIIVTRSTIGQLCRGDIVDVIDRTSRFPIGTCTLGEFTAYRKADRRR